MTEQYREDVACNDCSSSPIPSYALKLYKSADIHIANEALTVLFHSFMLDNKFNHKFNPKDVPKEAVYICMPQNWNGNGIFKIFYTHSCCPEFICCMTCVPLYKTVAVHGTICDIDCSESVNFKVHINQYLRQKPNFMDISEVFCNIDELFRKFMDDFYLPLLNLLHESHGIFPLYGLNALLDEISMYILEYLPVRGVLAMSAVNKKFNALANTSSLWKHLYQRDYSKDGIPDTDPSSSEVDWKEKYKMEYLRKRRRLHVNPWPLLSREYLPDIVPYRPYFDGEFGYDFDPRFPFAPSFHNFPPFSPLLPKYFRRLI